ncbi:molybdenum ABC transporter substrate-binding protein, partial [Candidatus Poribacteria bacterium]|nr:molybdenum ABC transporter substrate-binding protein [Candidatus Poribacteria bacterium]
MVVSVALLVACDRKELQPGERRLQTDQSKNGTSALNRSAQRSPMGTSEDLTFYCAAGMRLPIKQIVVDYEREYGVQVQVQYGGSGTLLSNIQTARIGDLYLAADESYIQRAREKKLLVESIPVARMKPVIAVPKGNPQQITSIQDLLQPDIRVALANPEAAAIGRITREVLQ